jgi:hypothetical protein
VNTDDLVTLLANRVQPVDSRLPARRTLFAALGGTAVAMLLMAELLGVRPTLAPDFPVPMFWAKEAFCAVLSVAGLAAVLRLARPGSPLGWVRPAIAAVVVVMWMLAAVALMGANAQDRIALILGQTASVCPFWIALLSLPLFAATFWTMKGLAPTRLRLAGAAGGFASGAIGALVYSLHCPELAAPFLGICYVLGIPIPTAVGAWVVPRLLRW